MKYWSGIMRSFASQRKNLSMREQQGTVRLA